MQIGKGEKSVLCEFSWGAPVFFPGTGVCDLPYPLLVMDHLVDDRLLDFLREELNLGFLALKLENWRKSGEDPDEMLMFLLQESDYYSANEISEYRQTLSSYRKQPAAQIKKLRGDALFGMRPVWKGG